MHVAIIGNGISGVTAAREIRKRDPDVRITIISNESVHHWSRPALMYIYMGHMRYEDTLPYEAEFWPKNRIDLHFGTVSSLDTTNRLLEFTDGEKMPFNKLIIATGSSPNRFGWPGQHLNRVGGMYSLSDLRRLEDWTPQINTAVIVGGGLIGVELAEMLHARGKQVIFLVREDRYWSGVLPSEESKLIEKVIQQSGIDLRLGTELKEIISDDLGNASAIVTSSGEHIACEYVGLTAGVHPNIGPLKDSDLRTRRGVCVDEYQRTNIEGIYAVGDCAEIISDDSDRGTIQAVWYTGRFQAEIAAANICRELSTNAGNTSSSANTMDKYEPGIWFNSAKFIDLEYQVYGNVPSERASAEAAEQGLSSVYWQDMRSDRAVRLVYQNNKDVVPLSSQPDSKSSDVFVGLNCLGIRYRHRLLEQWILEKRSMSWVVKHLKEACFDPEFFPQFDMDIAAKYNVSDQNHSISDTTR